MRKLWLPLLLALSTAHAQETVTLDFTYWGSAAEKRAVEQTIRKFEATHPNIKINGQYIPSDYLTKMNTLIASGREPDVAYMPEGRALELALQGKLLELQPHFKQFPELGNRLPATYLYFAPGRTVGTQLAAETFNLFYSRPAFRAAGLTLPPSDAGKAWTWAQFVDAARKLTLDRSGKNPGQAGFDANNIRQYGVTFPTWWGSWYPLVRANGGDITDATGRKYTLNSPAAVEVIQNLQDLMYKHGVAPRFTSAQSLPSGASQLQSGRAAMAFDGQWINLDLVQGKVDAGIGVLPRYKTGSKTILVGAGYVIFKSTRHPKEALEFYRAFNDPSAVDLYRQGLWLPLEKKYYTDARFINQWATGPAHGPEFKGAVIDYALNHANVSPTQRFRNWTAIESAINAGLDPVWTGKKTAKQALDDLAKTVQPLLQGVYPSK